MTYTRRPDDQRQTMLDQMLFLSGHETTCDITPVSFEAFVNARVRRLASIQVRDNDGGLRTAYEDVVLAARGVAGYIEPGRGPKTPTLDATLRRLDAVFDLLVDDTDPVESR